MRHDHDNPPLIVGTTWSTIDRGSACGHSASGRQSIGVFHRPGISARGHPSGAASDLGCARPYSSFMARCAPPWQWTLRAVGQSAVRQSDRNCLIGRPARSYSKNGHHHRSRFHRRITVPLRCSIKTAQALFRKCADDSHPRKVEPQKIRPKTILTFMQTTYILIWQYYHADDATEVNQAGEYCGG